MIIKKAQLTVAIITSIMAIVEWLNMIGSNKVYWIAAIVTITTTVGTIIRKVMI